MAAWKPAMRDMVRSLRKTGQARRSLVAFSITLIIILLLSDDISAQDNSRAALVIRHDDAHIQTACVELPKSEITGLELMQRSGLDLEIDVQGFGALVCRVDQTGCLSDDCWCQCKGGGECIYWSYWHQKGDEWDYSLTGANDYVVGNGDVEGWSWGPGNIDAALPPPNVSFEVICADFEAIDGSAVPLIGVTLSEPESAMPTGPTPQSAGITADFTTTAIPQLVDIGGAEKASGPRIFPLTAWNESAANDGSKLPTSPYSYAILGLIVFVLAGLLLISSLRRREQLGEEAD